MPLLRPEARERQHDPINALSAVARVLRSGDIDDEDALTPSDKFFFGLFGAKKSSPPMPSPITPVDAVFVTPRPVIDVLI